MKAIISGIELENLPNGNVKLSHDEKGLKKSIEVSGICFAELIRTSMDKMISDRIFPCISISNN